MKKQPEQTARTRHNMINTFWELAEKQGLDNVTISAITKKSGLNRGTFYVYFQNMDDLLEQAEDDIICDLRAKIRTAVDEDGFNNFETVFPKIIDIYAMYDDKLFIMLGKHGDPYFYDKIKADVSSSIREIFSQSQYLDNIEYITAYVTSGLIGLLTYWHDTGKKISIVELTKIVHSFLTERLLGMMT